LSEQGRAEAEAVGEALGALVPAPVALYCSPLERTVETAEAIGKRLGLEPIPEDALIEVDVGSWEGASLAALRRRREWQAVAGRPGGFRFPGGESLLELQARVVEFLQQLAARHPGASVVAVSHADPIRAAIAAAAGIHLDCYQRLFVAPCSVSVIGWGSTKRWLGTVNWTVRLDQALPSGPTARRRAARRDPAQRLRGRAPTSPGTRGRGDARVRREVPHAPQMDRSRKG
jgi:broad specificity phosphatase PhoE